MNKMLKRQNWDERKFALVSAVIISFFTFCVFGGQYLWSDVVTFQKNGDNLKQCYPAFIKIIEYMKSGAASGIDVGTFNGATEFFFRSNLPNMYMGVWFASFLMQYFDTLCIYLIFYVVHYFCALYFAQRLAQRFFGIDKWFSLLFAAGIARLAMLEMWYLSHFIVVCLVCPLIYFSLVALENKSYYKWILFSVPYTLAFTSGYITVSVSLAIVSFVFTVFYAFRFKKMDVKNAIVKSIIPPFIAGIFNVSYCLGLLIYMKDVVKNASSSLYDTLYYKVSSIDLLTILSGAIVTDRPLEQLDLLSLGIVWCYLLVIIVIYRLLSVKQEAVCHLFKISIGMNGLIVLISLGTITPLVLWFYSVVPIFGSMHLPMRYMMLTLPVLFLSICCFGKEMPEQKGKKVYARIAAGSLILIFVISILARYITFKVIHTDRMIVELCFISMLFYAVYIHGVRKHFAVIGTLAILFPSLTILYDYNEVGIFHTQIEKRSVVYNEDYRERLDFFVDGLEEKDRYLYAMFDSVESVPNFVPGNYEWFNMSRHNLTNYMGYEVQLCVPDDYLSRFWWFNQMDWQYIMDTRGDFLVLDNAAVDANMDLLGGIVDWENSNAYIDSTHRMLKLKKYIPSYYTGGMAYVEDQVEVLDNGYFYSPDLKKDALLRFETNNTTRFTAQIRADLSTDVAFLLYPNRYYHYYVDGEEIQPVIYDMQVFIPVEEGVHEIVIEYKNPLGDLMNYVYIIYYVLVVFALIICLFKPKKRLEKAAV